MNINLSNPTDKIEVGDMVMDIMDSGEDVLCVVVKLEEVVFHKAAELTRVFLQYPIITVRIDTFQENSSYEDIEEVRKFCTLVEKGDNLVINREVS